MISAVEAAHEGRYELEDQIVDCMAELGFEYRPPMDAIRALNSAGPPILSETPLFAGDRQGWPINGYGFTTAILKGLLAFESTGPASLNQAADFENALFGDPLVAGDNGCSGAAFSESAEVEIVLDLVQRRADAEQRVLRVLEGTVKVAAWRTCMAESGIPVSYLSDPARLVQEASEEILEEWRADGESPPSLELHFDAGSGRFVSTTSQELVDLLYKREVEIATADYACTEDLYVMALGLLEAEMRGD